MRKISGVMSVAALALLLGLWLAAPAWAAAKVPVYINGAYVVNNEWRGSDEEYRLLTQAVERGGHTYVPLRVVFEECGAEVSWDGAKQLIVADYDGNRRLIMQVGSPKVRLLQIKYADSPEWLEDGEVELQLEAAPYLQGGSVYVPLRFVAETMGCGVNWNGSKPEVQLKKYCLDDVIAGDKLYRLDRYSGRLTENAGSASRELGVIDLSYFADWDVQNYDLAFYQMELTPAGHYLAQVDVTIHGAITSGGNYCCWLAPEKGLAYTVLDRGYYQSGIDGKPHWLEYGDGSRELCLAGSEILFIDDEAGELKQRFEKGSFQWADQDWLLRGYGSSWELVNRRDKSIRDLSPTLLSEENKAKMDDMVRPYCNYLGPNDYDERVRELFWNDINNQMTIDPKPYIRFVGEDNGVLHFELGVAHLFYDDPEKQAQLVIPIDIQI